MNLETVDLTYSIAQKDALYAEWQKLFQEGSTYAQIGSIYNTTGETIRKRLIRWRRRVEQPKHLQSHISAEMLEQRIKTVDVTQVFDFTPFKDRLTDAPPIIESDNVLVTSDWELPDTDIFMVKAAFLIAIKYDLRRHIINGDYVANDATGINSYTPFYATDNTHFDQQMVIAESVTYAQSLWFTEGLHQTYGNHEDKLNRATGGQMGMYHTTLGKLINIVRYPHLWLKTKRGYAYIVHPRNYSSNSVVLGKKLYNTMLTPEGTKPKFVVVGHTHIDQSGYSEDGFCEIYGTGCMRNPKATAYINRQATTFPKWNQSFLMFKNGYVTKFSRTSTDWETELGELYPYLEKPIPEKLLIQL